MNLVYKDDIFNYDLAQQFIETEMLSDDKQKISFTYSFSSFKDDSSMKI